MNITFILEILRFLVILSILIFVHELGHYVIARLTGIKVVEFGLGFPPRVLSKKYKGTIYSLNALPIGGFVKLYGEDSSVKENRGQAYYHKGKLARAAVVTAGVIMNFFLAVLAFATITWVVGIPTETGKVKMIGILDNSPAQSAGLKEGDVVAEVNGQKVLTTKEFTDLVTSKKGEEILVTVDREGQSVTTKITPRVNPPQGQGPVGVVVSSSELVQPPLYQRPFIAIREGFNETVYWVKLTFSSISTTIAGVIKGQGAEGLSGPVGIYKITNEVAQEGTLSLISLVGLLSVNLAVLNIMPFPALDGGRLFFIVVEAIIGKKVNEKFEGYVHWVGIILLLTLMLAITFFNDLGGIAAIKNIHLPR